MVAQFPEQWNILSGCPWVSQLRGVAQQEWLHRRSIGNTRQLPPVIPRTTAAPFHFSDMWAVVSQHSCRIRFNWGCVLSSFTLWMVRLVLKTVLFAGQYFQVRQTRKHCFGREYDHYLIFPMGNIWSFHELNRLSCTANQVCLQSSGLSPPARTKICYFVFFHVDGSFQKIAICKQHPSWPHQR